MRLLLYIPPFVDVTAPLLGVPSLVAYLKEKGYSDIIVKDLNLEILNYLVESDYLDNQAKQVIRDFEKLNDLKELNAPGREEYEQLYTLYLFCKSKLYLKLGEYTDKIRDPEKFYDMAYYILNIKGFLDNCLKLINHKNSLGLDYLFACRIIEEISDDHPLFPDFYKSYLIPQVERIQPDIVGFSVCYSDQFYPSIYLARLIKEKFPAYHIVFGGTHLNLLKDRDLTTNKEYFSFVDTYLAGEGEIPFHALVKELDKKDPDFSRVPNLIYLDGNSILANESVDDLPVNELPTPDFSCLPLRNFLAPKPVLPYRITRGCYWNKCAFCVHFQTSQYSFRKPELVIKDIKIMIRQYDTEYFYFVDDSISKTFLEKFMTLLENEKLKITWVVNIRCEEFLTSEFIERLAQSGCRQLYLGIESGSQRILDIVKKGIKIDTVERIINDCHKNSISIKMNFIKGLPHEDKQDISDTLNFIRRTAKNCDIIALTPLGIGENTDIFRDPEHYGVEILGEREALRLFLTFKRTRGITSPSEIDRLYNDPKIFDRFTFFNRIHHLLYIPLFSEKDFLQFTYRLFIISEQVEKFLIRDVDNFHVDMEKAPLFSGSHQAEVFNYNVEKIKKIATNTGLKSRQTIYLYSLLNFEILGDISVLGYQLLTLCTGQKNVKEINADLKSTHSHIAPHDIETMTTNILRFLYKYKVIDFVKSKKPKF